MYSSIIAVSIDTDELPVLSNNHIIIPAVILFITLYRFDDDGKISAEIGEEGAPGPFERSSVYPGTD